MAVNKNAIIRYKTLDECFSNKYKKFTVNDLVLACNEKLSDYYGVDTTVSRRQIYDDINFMMNDSSNEMIIDKKKEGREVYYRYNEESLESPKIKLSKNDLFLIENTVELLTKIKGFPEIESLETIKTKLLDINNYGFATKLISFEENAFLVGLNYLVPLYNFIKNKQILAISYKPFKLNEIQVYTISPAYLKQYNKRWFLFGWNHSDNFIQNLALDRITNIESKNEIYIDCNVCFDEYFEDIIGVSNNLQDPIITIKIKLNEAIIPYIKSKPIHGSQKISANNLELKVKHNYELESLILSYGDNMQVLEPDSLVNSITTKIKNLNKMY